jgi:CRP-like cAMP-binding protein
MDPQPFQRLSQHLQQFIPLSEPFTTELKNRVQAKTFRKGELIHQSAFVCTKSYFILTGLVRTFYLKDGQEISEYFSGEQEWVNSPKSFIERTQDIYSIDALEETHVLSIHIADLGYLFDHFPLMERYARLSMGSVFGHLHERITLLRFTTAKEKYDHFLASYQGIHHRIPLGMVASYLGITQSTLSRLRAAN